MVQTGVQLLTGLLLTLPFHDTFKDLPADLLGVSLVGVVILVFGTVAGEPAGSGRRRGCVGRFCRVLGTPALVDARRTALTVPLISRVCALVKGGTRRSCCYVESPVPSCPRPSSVKE